MALVKIVQPRVTYADLERAPEDGRRYELYDGEVFVVPAPVPRHQIVQHLIVDLLRGHAARHGGLAIDSPIDIVFSQYDVLQPDVVFFSAARRHLVDLDSAIRHAPDLCVEVLLPRPRTETGPKDADRREVRRSRVLDRDSRRESIEIFQRTGSGYALITTASGDELITSPTVQGLSFQPASVFQIP